MVRVVFYLNDWEQFPCHQNPRSQMNVLDVRNIYTGQPTITVYWLG